MSLGPKLALEPVDRTCAAEDPASPDASPSLRPRFASPKKARAAPEEGLAAQASSQRPYGLYLAASAMVFIGMFAVLNTVPNPLHSAGLVGGAPDAASARRLGTERVTPGDLEKVRGDLEELLKADPDKGPTFVRLAWHSSATYDKMTKTGGSELGTIRFKEELAHNGNGGIDKAVAWLEPVKQANPSMSYADLYTLSGVVAIKTLGGPDIPWRAGRMDSMEPGDVTPNGRLPNADNGGLTKDSQHLRDIFYRMGFNDQEIVALSGAHTLGRCHAAASGFVGAWTPTPTKFNNLYFTILKNAQWEEGCIKDQTCTKHQYTDVASKRFIMLPTDVALIADPGFKQYVDLYAEDRALFFKDFSKAYATLLELGTRNLYVV